MYHMKEIVTYFLLFLLQTSSSTDTIGPNQSLKDGDILVSSGKAFALGFFSPGKSSNRYVGIWYNKVAEQTVVWVANRDNPINGTSGVLAIDPAGNLVLSNGSHNLSVWSTNLTSMILKKSSSAQLMDSGNFVLFQDQSKSVITWQSFDYPTNTILPNMKAGWQKRTGLNIFTSWKSHDDPGTGEYMFKLELIGTPQFFLFKGTKKIWRTGPWNGLGWSGVPEMVSNFIFKISYVENDDEVTITHSIKDPSIFSRLVVNESGTLERYTWQESERRWARFWSAPTDQCDSYAHCGASGNCNLYNLSEFECSCLQGFEPKIERQWYLRDASRGCKRKQGEKICGNGDGFNKVTNVKVPDTSIARVNKSLQLRECHDLCLKNCSCTAFASANISGGENGCLTWHGDLVDIRQFSNKGQDLYLRVPAVELAKYTRNSRGFRGKRLATTVIVSILAMLLIIFLSCWLLKKKRKGTEGQRKPLYSFSTGLTSYGNRGEERDGSGTSAEVSIFDLSTIVSATEDFSLANKLGEGGFGAVYKGRLPNGQEIAVKRLSKISGQGNEEFKNEITSIARLQHRNLVRLLGCCIQQDEKMLVYEYLPNKGLDNFIFDKERRSHMDWSKRFEIILGIARGMIYLHEDSRLRIIHRDLKASNILLDTSMNPKISDFGLARIFGVDQTEANTNRVVGTYGYMSPEYAMEGLFSIKSDVYSFGVLLLEIICGRKNSSFFQDNTVNLVGYVWDLWKEDRALDVVDSSLNNSYEEANKVLRCIHVGLLCVQEYAPHRPTMSEVIFMLCNETTLPYPKQPAFVFNKASNTPYSSSASVENRSVNDMSITVVEAR
ncbi:G-type lectin S-receptor-like serine/threonine-protein kinase [Forsythia ovata]|uniref:Receptor-like serine/threonine-protein kinase n=1 Tax=Forsythia ovata TaxID=205694 RepID=A0ABD1NTX2_9LAMI